MGYFGNLNYPVNVLNLDYFVNYVYKVINV